MEEASKKEGENKSYGRGNNWLQPLGLPGEIDDTLKVGQDYDGTCDY